MAYNKEYYRAYYLANRERKKATGRAWRVANRERVKATTKAWQKANPERCASYTKAWTHRNREHVAATNKAYYEANRERCLMRSKISNSKVDPKQEAARARAYRKANPEKAAASTKAWRKRNLKKVADIAKNYRKNNLDAKLAHVLRTRLCEVLKGVRKSFPTMKLLGCDIDWLKAWFEVQFKPGMTWENYGPLWHVDHKRPCTSFDLNDPRQQRLCFHWTNLQPLFAEENIRKGNRWVAEAA